MLQHNNRFAEFELYSQHYVEKNKIKLSENIFIIQPWQKRDPEKLLVNLVYGFYSDNRGNLSAIMKMMEPPLQKKIYIASLKHSIAFSPFEMYVFNKKLLLQQLEPFKEEALRNCIIDDWNIIQKYYNYKDFTPHIINLENIYLWKISPTTKYIEGQELIIPQIENPIFLEHTKTYYTYQEIQKLYDHRINLRNNRTTYYQRNTNNIATAIKIAQHIPLNHILIQNSFNTSTDQNMLHYHLIPELGIKYPLFNSKGKKISSHATILAWPLLVYKFDIKEIKDRDIKYFSNVEKEILNYSSDNNLNLSYIIRKRERSYEIYFLLNKDITEFPSDLKYDPGWLESTGLIVQDSKQYKKILQIGITQYFATYSARSLSKIFNDIICTSTTQSYH